MDRQPNLFHLSSLLQKYIPHLLVVCFNFLGCAHVSIIEKFVVEKLPDAQIMEAQKKDFAHYANLYFGELKIPHREIVRIEYRIKNETTTVILANYFPQIWEDVTQHGANAMVLFNQERISEHEVRARVIGVVVSSQADYPENLPVDFPLDNTKGASASPGISPKSSTIHQDSLGTESNKK